jgi:zinc transporter, ZIP family
MSAIISYFESINPILGALYATLFTWGVTALGASFVFFFKKMNRGIFDGMLGFTGGVMVAASVWSLIIPAISIGEDKATRALGEQALGLADKFGFLMPVIVGFSLGALFIYGIDKIMPHLHINFRDHEKEGVKTDWHRTTLLTLAITMHNIPEGLAIGVMFGGVAAGIDGITIPGAVALALGIGIQNFPEGIAVAMPMRRQGLSRWKSFNFGQLSALVEPFAAVLGAWAVYTFTPILPYALAFAAGAMIYVVVEEVIPETQRDKYTDIATLGFLVGFMVMMSLDVALS